MGLPSSQQSEMSALTNKLRPQVVAALLAAVLFSLFCIAAGGLFITETVLFIRDSLRPTVAGKITRSDDAVRQDGKLWFGPYFERLVIYEYTVGSQVYYREDWASAPSEGELNKFSLGQNVLVYYDSRHPRDSFLGPVSFPWPWLILGTVFSAAGIYGFYRVSKRARSTGRLSKEPPNSAAVAAN